MVIHRHSDGSEGFQFELGDVVEITDVVSAGAWFRRAIGRIGPVVRIEPYNKEAPSWRTAFLRVKDLPDWGTSHCAPWQVKPVAETYDAATVITA